MVIVVIQISNSIFHKKAKKLDFAKQKNVFNGFIYYASFISELSEKSLRIQ